MSEYWIQTFTGKCFDLLEPTEDMICVEDIAHHLSIENRYHGATKFAYSVGYHSIIGMGHIADEYKLEFLFHDAHEAYYKDLSTDWKECINLASHYFYEDVINIFDRTLSKKFLLDLRVAHSEIKEVDINMCRTEKDQLMIEVPYKWKQSVLKAKPYNIDIMKLQPENVEQLFLAEYNKWRRC